MPARRRFIGVAGASLASAALPGVAGASEAGFGLGRFIELSRVLTGVDDPGGEGLGRLYLAALQVRSDGGEGLRRLWQMGGFGGATPPRSVADLAARGVFDDPALARLADDIVRQWYTGLYPDADGRSRVATYPEALAWRALEYRPAGPGTCGGAFGHWSDVPGA
ncbi:MAG: hypothetical protein H2060_08290 [Azoarcus sp.]|nr:hypothetical protein [Azoarcus sp.]